MKVKSLFVSMLAMAALASCSQDEQPNLGGESNVIAGQKTYATFTFNVEGGAKTRGAMSPEAADETAITDLRLLIFDGEGTDGKLLVNDVVSAADKTNTVETTSGVKRIFVLANSDAATSAEIGGKLGGMALNTTTLAQFYALMSNPAGGETSVAAMGDGFTQMIATGKMLMSNVADASSKQTLAPNVTLLESQGAAVGTVGKNHFKFIVKRAVAKGNLAVKKAETEDGFNLTDITYGVRNVNRSVNYVQQFENHNVIENDLGGAHDAAPIRPWAPYYNAFDGAADLDKPATFAPYYYGGFAIAGTDAQVAPVAPATPGDRAKSAYFTENSNKQQLKGNSTYFGIAASLGNIANTKVVGTFSVNGLSGSVTTTAAAAGYTAGGNFYMIRKFPAGVQFASAADSRSIFTEATVAWKAIYDVLIKGSVIKVADYANATALQTAVATDGKMVKAAAGGTFNLNNYFGEYTGGKCYYRLDIFETVDGNKRHLVRRNHNYVATVNTFATIGEPTEGDLNDNPEIPVDAEKTYVTATIEVLGWHDVTMGGDL